MSILPAQEGALRDRAVFPIPMRGNELCGSEGEGAEIDSPGSRSP